MFRFNVFLIFARLILVVATHSVELNDTCIDLSFEKLHNNFQSAFMNVAETPIYNHAKVLYQVANSEGEISYDVSVRWAKADVENKRTRTYMRNINLIQDADGQLARVNQGMSELPEFVSL